MLDGVSLHVEAGTSVHIDGANGAGKTTLLRIAAGIVLPDRGAVELEGLSPTRRGTDYNRRVGYLSASGAGVYPRLTVAQQLELWGGLALMSRAEVARAVVDALDIYALGELAARRLDRLSMGQRQRVRLAGAFLHRPSLALLDEPLNSLDEDGAQLVVSAVETRCADGGTVLWCAPEGEHVPYAPDRRLSVRAGRLEEPVANA